MRTYSYHRAHVYFFFQLGPFSLLEGIVCITGGTRDFLGHQSYSVYPAYPASLAETVGSLRPGPDLTGLLGLHCTSSASASATVTPPANLAGHQVASVTQWKFLPGGI